MNSLTMFSALNMWGSRHILESSLMGYDVQYRFPASKKRRIRKKWSKRARNWRTVPIGDVVLMDAAKILVTDPGTARKLSKAAYDTGTD